jgi:hypothetical protein
MHCRQGNTGTLYGITAFYRLLNLYHLPARSEFVPCGYWNFRMLNHFFPLFHTRITAQRANDGVTDFVVAADQVVVHHLEQFRAVSTILDVRFTRDVCDSAKHRENDAVLLIAAINVDISVIYSRVLSYKVDRCGTVTPSDRISGRRSQQSIFYLTKMRYRYLNAISILMRYRYHTMTRYRHFDAIYRYRYRDMTS